MSGVIRGTNDTMQIEGKVPSIKVEGDYYVFSHVALVDKISNINKLTLSISLVVGGLITLERYSDTFAVEI